MKRQITFDWGRLVRQIQHGASMSLQKIADECGFASRGTLHDLTTGKSTTCSYERGDALVRLHKRVMRRKVKA